MAKFADQAKESVKLEMDMSEPQIALYGLGRLPQGRQFPKFQAFCKQRVPIDNIGSRRSCSALLLNKRTSRLGEDIIVNLLIGNAVISQKLLTSSKPCSEIDLSEFSTPSPRICCSTSNTFHPSFDTIRTRLLRVTLDVPLLTRRHMKTSSDLGPRCSSGFEYLRRSR